MIVGVLWPPYRIEVTRHPRRRRHPSLRHRCPLRRPRPLRRPPPSAPLYTAPTIPPAAILAQQIVKSSDKLFGVVTVVMSDLFYAILF